MDYILIGLYFIIQRLRRKNSMDMGLLTIEEVIDRGLVLEVNDGNVKLAGISEGDE